MAVTDRARFGEVGSEDVFNPRTMSPEEGIERQIDRIAYLRSHGHPWAEALYQLRDMVVGLEDEEFWDGLPAKERQRVEALEGEGKVAAAGVVRKRYAAYGWNGAPVRAFRGPGGRPVFVPTAEDLSNQLRIVLRLLARKRLRWRTRPSSRLGVVEEA